MGYLVTGQLYCYLRYFCAPDVWLHRSHGSGFVVPIPTPLDAFDGWFRLGLWAVVVLTRAVLVPLGGGASGHLYPDGAEPDVWDGEWWSNLAKADSLCPESPKGVNCT